MHDLLTTLPLCKGTHTPLVANERKCGVLKSINALGKTFSTWLESADEKIGYTYLNYYDDPSMESSTGSAPSGGYLTVKYKDHE